MATQNQTNPEVKQEEVAGGNQGATMTAADIANLFAEEQPEAGQQEAPAPAPAAAPAVTLRKQREWGEDENLEAKGGKPAETMTPAEIAALLGGEEQPEAGQEAPAPAPAAAPAVTLRKQREWGESE